MIIRLLFKLLFFISVFFKNIILKKNKRRNVYLYLLLPILLLTASLLVSMFVFFENEELFRSVLIVFMIYIQGLFGYLLIDGVYKAFNMWKAIKNNITRKAKVNKLYTQKRILNKKYSREIYYLNMMDFEYNVESKKYKFTDMALLKLDKSNEELWEFDKEATSRELTEKELKENYLSEFEVFVCLKNPKIHVIKNYNLHRIYEKANGREID